MKCFVGFLLFAVIVFHDSMGNYLKIEILFIFLSKYENCANLLLAVLAKKDPDQKASIVITRIS